MRLHIKMLRLFLLAAIISHLCFSPVVLAQEKSANGASGREEKGVKEDKKLSAAGPVELTPEQRERLAMLERIEKLERRLAELEGGTKPAPRNESAGEPSSEKTVAQAARGLSEVRLPVAANAVRDAGGQMAGIEQTAWAVPLGPSAVPEKKKAAEPFAFADFTWLTGNSRQKEFPLDSKVFTGEFRADVAYHHSFNHPRDNTIGGSTEVFRSAEVQLTDLAVGGDFHYNNVRGRLLTQFGMYSQTQPRNDPSPARGQWNLDNAYRYLSEAYGGYHWDKWNGINVDGGIFLSYIGLFSFYQFDNWAYQPSYVSSNTPWYFTGVRVQIFPTEKLKIEPWFINGWQSYGKFNKAPGVGGQILWRPNGSISVVLNNYWGTDTLGNADRKRFHTDDSIQVKYYDNPARLLDKAAFTFTFDAGCEYGGGVSCAGGSASSPSQYFLGFMVYNRFWFHKDLFAMTLGGGAITNPGRYLVLLPPINGATAFSGTPFFTANPGDQFKAWDSSFTFDYMPSQFATFRTGPPAGTSRPRREGAGVTVLAVQALVRANTEGRALGLLGEPRVNVLRLNLALDEQFPVKR